MPKWVIRIISIQNCSFSTFRKMNRFFQLNKICSEGQYFKIRFWFQAWNMSGTKKVYGATQNVPWTIGCKRGKWSSISRSIKTPMKDKSFRIGNNITRQLLLLHQCHTHYLRFIKATIRWVWKEGEFMHYSVRYPWIVRGNPPLHSFSTV